MDSLDKIVDILAEYRARRERGEDVSPEALLEEHPDLADELGDHLEALALLEGDDDDDAPKQIGEFKIVREIGRGGMGVVYEAEQASMRRRVALKVLYPAITALPDAVKRFRQEAWAAGRLKHTNIVAVHHLAKDDGYWYAAMELVEGRSLDRVIDDLRGQRPRESRLARRVMGEKSDGIFAGSQTGTRAYYLRVAEMFAEVADALHEAHDQSVIHRDIKPANLLLEHTGHLKIVDFGLARLEDAASLTTTGDLLGTPYYMSPEQIGGQTDAVDHRSDIYALGATLYETLALRPPFRGHTVPDLAAKIVKADPPPLRRWDKSLPRDLETIVMKALEKDPAQRYQTAREMARDLECFAVGETIRARRTSLATRGWRKVQRHKVRSGLITGLVLALGVSLALVVSKAASDRRLAYQRLLDEGEIALALTSYERDAFHLDLADRTAAGIFSEAVDLDPEHHEAYLGRAMALGRSLEERLADFDAARARGLSARVHRLGRVLTLMQAGRVDEAEREPPVADSPPDAAAFFFEAGIAALHGRMDEAEAKLTEVVDAPQPAPLVRFVAIISRARMRTRRGDLEGAIEDCAAMRAAGDRTFGPRVLAAVLWGRLGRVEKRRALFDAMLEELRARGDVLGWRGLALACGWNDRHAWQLEACREGLARHPNDGELLVHEVQALVQLEMWADAEAALATLLAAAPDEPRAQLCAGLVRGAQGKLTEALAHFDAAARMGADDTLVLRLRTNAYAECGRNEQARRLCEQLLEQDPFDVTALNNLSAVFYGLNDYEQALAYADRAVRLHPTFGHGHAGRGKALFRMRRYPEALAAMQTAARLGFDDADFHADLAQIWHRLQRFDRALEHAEAALERDPSLVRAVENKAWAFHAMGQPHQALVHWRAVLEQRESESALRGIAATLVVLGKFEEAEEHARRALELYPDHPEAVHNAWEAIGQALLGRGRPADAHAALLRAVDTDETCPVGWFQLGRACEALGRPDDALEAYSRVLAIAPDDVNAYNNRATLYMARGAHDEALADFRAGLKLAPKHLHLNINLAKLYRDQGAFDKALEQYERTIALAPDWPDVYYSRAVAFFHMKRHDKALADLDEVVALSGATNADLERRRGLCLLHLERWEGARDAYARVLKDHPDDLEGLFSTGTACRALEEREAAIAAYHRFLALRPDQMTKWDRIAFERVVDMLLALERNADAMTWAEKAQARFPEYALFRFKHAFALHRTKDYAKAAAAYARYLDDEPEDAAALGNLAMVSEMLLRMEQVDACCTRALAIEAKDAGVLSLRARARALLGRFEDAQADWDAAVAIEPALGGYVEPLLVMGRAEPALEHARRCRRPEPLHRLWLVAALRANGERDEARRVALEYVGAPLPADAIAESAYVAAVAGREKLAAELIENASDAPHDLVWRARARVVLGEQDAAKALVARVAGTGFRLPREVPDDFELGALTAGLR